MASGSVFKENFYTHAIVGVVKSTVAEEAEVDTYALKYQHDYLLRILRDMNVNVIEVDFQGPFTGSLLLDRVAVSVNGVLTNLKVILQQELNQLVIEQNNPDARVCGADVLIQGREIFVGISETTNEAGAVELAEAFKDFPVTAIRMPRGTTHLKDYITSGGKGMLVVGPSSEAQEIQTLLEREAEAFLVKMHGFKLNVSCTTTGAQFFVD
ncbi:Uncharacterized protein OBRU01_23017 [Operophtera brumata]|uniref:Uncharacterized protein n=1 Tax=Operophtera brumata TaxID=104452 RepID=A0A0L7KQK9_OPEBR|nr:Uncharacterized protein OBRU01_23017 [Operophtera brumata]